MTATRRGEHGDLLVCGTCGEVKGPVPVWEGEPTQLCACASREERRSQPRYGRDYPRWVELCYCCGLATVNSGSRWSGFHCRRCLHKVRALNELMGRCVIPIGRHSLMNSVSLRGDKAHGDALTAFADQLNAFIGSCDDLVGWARSIALANLETMGYRPGADVFVDTYLRRARRLKLSSAPALRALLGSMMSADEADLLAALCEEWGEQGWRAERAVRDLPSIFDVELDPELVARLLTWKATGTGYH